MTAWFYSLNLCNHLFIDEKTGYPPQQGGPYPPAQGGPYPPAQGGQYPPPQGGQYPPPQGGQYPPQQGYGQAQQTTIITTQPTVIAGGILRFSEFPMQITCPHCQAQVVTSCNYVDGTAVWVIALLICLFGYVIVYYRNLIMLSIKNLKNNWLYLMGTNRLKKLRSTEFKVEIFGW